MNKTVGATLVLGGEISGIQAALDLADAGFKVYMVDESPSIGGTMAQLDKTFPTNDCAMCILAPIKLGNLLKQPLEEIWIHNELLNYVRNRKALKGSCKICAYSDLCGGCRYTAYVAYRDWMGPDVSCPFGPKILEA